MREAFYRYGRSDIGPLRKGAPFSHHCTAHRSAPWYCNAPWLPSEAWSREKPSSAPAGASKKGQAEKELKGLGRTSSKVTLRKSSASKAGSKKKGVKVIDAKQKKERPLTKKQMLNRRFGPDNPEDYYDELRKRKLTLQGGSPGSGKRR